MRPLVQRMGHVTLGVTDLQQAAEDAQNILGARVVDLNDTQILLSSNQRHAELIYRQADENAVQICGLEAVSANAVDAVRANCVDNGLRIVTEEPSLSCMEQAVTFATSEGHIFEVHTPMPEDRSIRYRGAGVHPKSLDHINFTAVDPQRFTEEMHASCGLLLSQRTSGFEISWMRAANFRHHTVAAVKSSATGVHHISWEVPAFQDFKTAADSLIIEKRKLLWGPGRHGPGDNLFIYYRDASGFMIECIAEMELILDDDQPPNILDPGEKLSNPMILNQWGDLPPQTWVEHFTPFAKSS